MFGMKMIAHLNALWKLMHRMPNDLKKPCMARNAM
jgi:hypothetical protein